MTTSETNEARSPGRWLVVYGWLAGFGVGVIVLVVAPIWQPRNANYLIPNYWAFAFGATCVGSYAAVFALGRGWLRWAIAMSVGVLCAFAIRVSIDVSHDRTNHNLLPFELVGELVVTLFWALLGSAAGQLTRRLADRDESEGPYAPRWKRPGR